MKRTTILGLFFFFAATTLVGGVLYYNSARRSVPIVFSPTQMLRSLWEEHKREHLEASTGRTLDRTQGNITTSEGQSYTMLRAVWMDDKATFDRSLRFARENLQHDDDALFAWLFGKRADGSYGILTDRGGAHSASDADTDIALALLLAHRRWGDANYLTQARAIISDIWEEEVVMIRGVPYLAANNIEKENPERIIVNLSYLAPYAYRLFAEVDTAHPWNTLVKSSYDLIERASAASLGASKSVGLPPDWIAVNRTSGALTRAPSNTLSTHFGYDAMRVPWRMALDLAWNREERASEILKSFSFLSREWEGNGQLAAVYGRDGKKVDAAESPAVYGGALGFFLADDPRRAEEVYLAKLQALYSPDTASWKKPLAYYDDNWVWFGMALYHGALTPLDRTASAWSAFAR